MDKKYLIVFVFTFMCLFAFAEERCALLIANGDYSVFGKLQNPVPEASALQETLKKLGFEVRIIKNATQGEMEEAIDNFKQKLKAKKGIGFFHYGGHGIQLDGENFLIPTNADIKDRAQIRTNTINLSRIMESMVADTNIIVLDCCRDSAKGLNLGASGFQSVQSSRMPANSIIVYSVEAERKAADGVFTPILTKRLSENEELGTVLLHVKQDVYKTTNGTQTPGILNKLKNKVFLARGISNQVTQIDLDNTNKELARLKADYESAKSKTEKAVIDAKIKEKEAEKRRQELDLQTRMEVDARRKTEDSPKKNEDQRVQNYDKMKKENENKILELQKEYMQNIGNIDELVIECNKKINEIDKIKNKNTYLMNKDIAEIKNRNIEKRKSIKIGKYESDKEFAERLKKENAKIDIEEKSEIAKVKEEYKKKSDSDVTNLQGQLQDMMSKEFNIIGQVSFNGYYPNQKRFPFTITDKNNPNLRKSDYIDVSVYDEKERIQKCEEIDINIKSNRYYGCITYGVVFDEKNKLYVKNVKKFSLRDIDDNVDVIYKMSEERLKKSEDQEARFYDYVRKDTMANACKQRRSDNNKRNERIKEANRMRVAQGKWPIPLIIAWPTSMVTLGACFFTSIGLLAYLKDNDNWNLYNDLFNDEYASSNTYGIAVGLLVVSICATIPDLIVLIALSVKYSMDKKKSDLNKTRKDRFFAMAKSTKFDVGYDLNKKELNFHIGIKL